MKLAEAFERHVPLSAHHGVESDLVSLVRSSHLQAEIVRCPQKALLCLKATTQLLREGTS
jgi:hypothetical protein